MRAAFLALTIIEMMRGSALLASPVKVAGTEQPQMNVFLLKKPTDEPIATLRDQARLRETYGAELLFRV